MSKINPNGTTRFTMCLHCMLPYIISGEGADEDSFVCDVCESVTYHKDVAKMAGGDLPVYQMTVGASGGVESISLTSNGDNPNFVKRTTDE